MKKILVLVLLLMSFTSFQTTYASSTGIIGPDVIHKEANKILTTSDILSMYQSSLGGITIQQDGYTGYGNILGSYYIMLYASDGTLAETKEIEVRVISTLGDVQAVSDLKNIHVTTEQSLSPSEIVYVLEKTGYVEITATTQMVILNNAYTGYEETPGTYLFEFRLVNAAGLDQIYLSQIIVKDAADDFVPDVIFEGPPNVVSSVLRGGWILLQYAIAIVFAYYIIKFIKKHKRGGTV